MTDQPDDATLHNLLREHYGYDTFRPRQLEAIRGTLAGRDVLLLLPTGGGKSLCFQLPSLAKNQITIVVTPLLALAHDQVQGLLDDHNVEAASWSSTTSESRKDSIVRDLTSDDGTLRLLYTTPESIATERLLDTLRVAHALGRLCSLAIDEAHACSQWGHDFRPSYLALGSLRTRLPGLPCIAVTATATPEVRSQISEILELRDPLVILSSFNRPELRFAVRHKELMGTDGSEAAAMAELATYIRSRPGESGIVYCRLRATCDRVASALSDEDIHAQAYHAGLDSSRRVKIQSNWKEGDVDVVVATIAFGMGIDAPHVRWVVHFDPPASLEGLYQEAGRAGRDGQPADSLVFCSDADLHSAKKMERGARAGATAAVAEYLQEPTCRRQALIRHFGEKRGRCSASDGDQLCDFCENPRQVIKSLAAVEAKLEAAKAQAAGKVESDGGDVADPYDTCDPGSDQKRTPSQAGVVVDGKASPPVGPPTATAAVVKKLQLGSVQRPVPLGKVNGVAGVKVVLRKPAIPENRRVVVVEEKLNPIGNAEAAAADGGDGGDVPPSTAAAAPVMLGYKRVRQAFQPPRKKDA